MAPSACANAALTTGEASSTPARHSALTASNPARLEAQRKVPPQAPSARSTPAHASLVSWDASREPSSRSTARNTSCCTA